METTRHDTDSLVRRTRRELGVTRKLFSRLTGFSERAIASWESGGRPSARSRQRILELRRLEQALSLVKDPESIGDWLQTPNSAFEGLKPLEVIERGQIDRIWRMVFELESGVPA